LILNIWLFKPKLGSAWIAPRYVQQFAEEVFQIPSRYKDSFKVEFSEYGDKWSVSGYPKISSLENNSIVKNKYGVKGDLLAYDILEMALNFKRPEIKRDKRYENGRVILDREGKPVKEVDIKKTTEAEQKQAELKKRFIEWAFENPDRRKELVEVFNERFNSIRLREYDGSNLNLTGINPNIILQDHQKNAIARILYSGNTLIPYPVGAGKTFIMVAAAMEGKRLGLHNKPMFAVPNHLTEQIADDFRKLYPAANILVADKRDMEKGRRRDFMAKIATNNFDAVIIGHSSFDRLRLSPEKEAKYIQDELNILEIALSNAKQNGEKGFSVKQIEKSIQNYESKLKTIQSKVGDDGVIPFEQLGIDKVFIDESHNYKNLDLPTKMTRIAGLGSKGSGKSLALLMKCKELSEFTDNKGIVFASGTPVSNSMTEMYTIMRYLQPEVLEQAGIKSFDQWASVFADITHSMELKPECDGKYQMKTRIQKYNNFNQLLTMFGLCADIRAAGEITLPVPEHTKVNVVAPATPPIKLEMMKLNKRATMIRKGKDENGNKLDPKKDNFLKLTTDGKKIGLDPRLMNPNAPDHPNSKINICVKNVLQEYKESADVKGTQVLFCDLSTPKTQIHNTYTIYKKDYDGEYNAVYSAALKNKGHVFDFEELHEKFTDTRKMPKPYREDNDKLGIGDVIVISKLDTAGNTINEAQIVGEKGLDGDAGDDFFDNVELERFVSKDAPKKFCAYDDIKEKLIKNGIPENEIAFIHDYEKSKDKQGLYQKMNEGEIRVLIGSTYKCGAGMNAQKRMVALHHVDAPLRPSDMEQREGRILRQGNDNKHVKIYRYSTDRTFDAYTYQILENKQKFIGQLMAGKLKVNNCEDIDDKVLDFAEVKALIAGNPLIKEKIELERDINILRILEASFMRQKFDTEDKLQNYPLKIESAKSKAKNTKIDIQTLSSQQPELHPENPEKEVFPLTLNTKIDGQTEPKKYYDREEAGEALRSLILKGVGLPRGSTKEIGEYKGFTLSLYRDALSVMYDELKILISGTATDYMVDINMDENVNAAGNMSRINNILNNLPKRLESQEQIIKDLEADEQILKQELETLKAFPQKEKLNNLETELIRVDAELRKHESTEQSPESLLMYEFISDIFPTIISGEETKVKLTDNLVLQHNLEDNTHTMAYTQQENGKTIYDPAITFQIIPEKEIATPIRFTNNTLEVDIKAETNPKNQSEINNIALSWLNKAYSQAHERIKINPQLNGTISESDIKKAITETQGIITMTSNSSPLPEDEDREKRENRHGERA